MTRVLLIEPDASFAEIINMYLSRHEFEVITAKDSQQAIIEADHVKPDVVVLELAIPKNNGIAFLQEFRSYTDWLPIPIIIYSRISREETGWSEEEWQKHGVINYLYKPTKPLASLLNNIQTALNNYENV